MSRYNMYPIPDEDLPINKKEKTIDITKLFNPGYSYNKNAITNPLLQAFMGDGKSTKKGRKQGKSFSNVDLMKMQWDYSMAQEERQYNEYLYNQYESPAAQMRQYQQAGLNPALMYQGATGGHVASSNNAPTSTGIGNGTQETNGFDTFSRIIDMITGAIGMKNQIDATRSQIAVNETQAAKNIADARKTGKEADRYDEITDANLSEIRSRVANINIDSELKQSQIEVNKVHKDVEITEADLNRSKKILTDFQSKLAEAETNQINAILPYLADYKEAEIEMMNAKTKESKASAYKLHQDAAYSLLKQLGEQKLLDGEYYETLVEHEKTDAANATVELTLGSILNVASSALEGFLGIKGLKALKHQNAILRAAAKK